MIERGALPGFQKPQSASKPKAVGLAVVTYSDHVAQCSCGWGYSHLREKVREDAVDKHINSKHNGRGIRL